MISTGGAVADAGVAHAESRDALLPPAWCVAAVCLLVFGLGVAAVLSLRGLFADGSWYLVRVLDREAFYSFAPAREYGEWLTQAPVVFALRLGVTDLDQLLLLHSLGLFLLPALAWAGAFVALRRDVMFWPFVLLFAAVHLNGSLGAIGNYNQADALVALSMALLLRRAPLSPAHALLLLAVAVALLRMYESMALLGPLLVGCGLFRASRTWRPGKPLSGLSSADRLVAGLLQVTAILLLVATAIAAHYVAYPQNTDNLADARRLDVLDRNRQLGFSVALAAVYALLLLAGHQTRTALVLAALGIACLIGVELYANWGAAGPYFDARGWVGILMFAFGSSLLVWRVLGLPRGLPREAAVYALVGLPVALLLLLAAVDLRHSYEHGRYVACFREEVRSRSGVVRTAATRVGDCGPYGWHFTYPSMSLLMRDKTDGAIVLNPAPVGQPFDPEVSVPDLSRYY